MIVVVSGACVLGILLTHEEPSIATDVETCYSKSDPEYVTGGSQAKFEACLCELAETYGCRTAKKAVPKIHHEFIEPCCTGDEDREPVKLHD